MIIYKNFVPAPGKGTLVNDEAVLLNQRLSGRHPAGLIPPIYPWVDGDQANQDKQKG